MTSQVFPTDSVEWTIDADNYSTPEVRSPSTNLDLERGGTSALHNGPQGLWVEPHPRFPEGVTRTKTFTGTNPNIRYGDTITIFNPDAYDKKAIFSLSAMIFDYDVSAQVFDYGWHVMRFGVHDDMEEVARVITPASEGCDRRVPLVINATRVIDVPAGSGMKNRRINADGSISITTLSENPDAPQVVVARLTHYFTPHLVAGSTAAGNQLLWSYVMA